MFVKGVDSICLESTILNQDAYMYLINFNCPNNFNDSSHVYSGDLCKLNTVYEVKLLL